MSPVLYVYVVKFHHLWDEAAMPVSERIRFQVNWEKALEALVWLSETRPGITFYYVAKVFFYADKMHLQKYGRPVLGDRYVAMEHGPVPSMVYNILKKEDFLDPDILDAAASSINISHDTHPAVHNKREPALDYFSETDLQCLEEAVKKYADMPISQLRRLTHQERAYVEAQLNGEMDYSLMIDEDVPDRDELIEEIQETAAYVVM